MMTSKKDKGNEEDSANYTFSETFKQSFKDKYFPKMVRVKLERDFIGFVGRYKQQVE